MLRDIHQAVNASVVKSIWRSVLAGGSAPPVILPEYDYIVFLGSSTTYMTYTVNAQLGRQDHAARKVFTDAGYEVPILNRGVSGYTIANLDTNVNSILTALGPISAADPSRVAVIINIGSNDIGENDYDAMAAPTKAAMLSGLNSIITKVEAFGFTPIVGTSNSRKDLTDIYDEWAEKFYRPVVESRTPYWYASPLAVFDFCQLYTDNKDVPNWWDPDEVHPWMGTQPIQQYTISQLASKSTLPAYSPSERVLFCFPTSGVHYNGGLNAITGAASGSLASVYTRNGQLISGASFSWTGAAGTSGGVRPNAGAWNVDLSHNLIQSSNLYKSAGAIPFTANFGVANAGRSGTLRATASSNVGGRLTRVTTPQGSAVINASGPGIQIVDVPFTLDGSGVVIVTVAPESPSTIANIGGFDFVFN